MADQDWAGAAEALAVSGTLSAGALSMTSSTTPSANWPTGSGGYFIAVIDRTGTPEKVKVTARSGANFTIERGYDGTSDVQHANGASIEHCIDSLAFDRFQKTYENTIKQVSTGAQILISTASEVMDGVTVSGDATLAATGALTIANDAVENAMIADDAVDSDQIAAGAVDLAHMSANSVDSDQYVDGSIDRVHLAADIVDGTKIEDDAVDSEHVAAGAIDNEHLADGDTVTIAETADEVLSHVATFSRTGTLVTGTGTMRFRFPYDATLKHTRLSVGTAPTGAAVIVDVNLDGTTIYTTQANRPEIDVSTNVENAQDAPDVTAVTAGSYLTVDIDQIGSTIAGADLVVNVYYVLV